MIIVQIAGRLGRDPETRFTPSGLKVTNLTVATTVRKGGKEETVWWRVTMTLYLRVLVVGLVPNLRRVMLLWLVKRVTFDRNSIPPALGTVGTVAERTSRPLRRPRLCAGRHAPASLPKGPRPIRETRRTACRSTRACTTSSRTWWTAGVRRS